jgi:hypothetical protein
VIASGDDRVERLERALARWRVVASFALVIAIASLAASLMSLRFPEEIRARAFVVVDGSGEVVSRLGEVKDWGPVLSVNAKRARATVMVGSMGADAGVAVVAEDGTMANLAVGANGGPGLSVSGPGKNKLIAGFIEKGSPLIGLFDEKGSRLTVTTDGIKTPPPADTQP